MESDSCYREKAAADREGGGVGGGEMTGVDSASGATRRKASNPNKDEAARAEKKAQKEERDRLRKRAEEIKQASWKYGLGSAGVFIGGMCLYSLLTISRSTITTVALDDAVLLKEVSSDCVVSACMAR